MVLIVNSVCFSIYFHKSGPDLEGLSEPLQMHSEDRETAETNQGKRYVGANQSLIIGDQTLYGLRSNFSKLEMELLIV